MFGRRRNNSGIIWASLLGLGVSAAAYGIGKNQNRNMLGSVQNLMNNFRIPTSNQMPKMSTLTELSKELTPNEDSLNNE